MKTTDELMDLVHSDSPTTAIPPIVLVVDDDDATLELYDALLTHHGYWVARAETGLKALECAQDLQPNAIVTDVGLPGDMDGTDLIRELHADEKLCTVPILLVTGRTPRDLPSLTGLPISGLLLKPVAPETLVTRVEGMLRASSPPTSCAPETRETTPCTSPTSEAKVDRKRRLCPQCGTRLTWVETRRWSGVTYDYYRECANGCGLACFNRALRTFEMLVPADGESPSE